MHATIFIAKFTQNGHKGKKICKTNYIAILPSKLVEHSLIYHLQVVAPSELIIRIPADFNNHHIRIQCVAIRRTFI